MLKENEIQGAIRNRSQTLLLLMLAGLMLALCLWRADAGPIIDGLPFKDSDDIMRLLQVQRWLETGDWLDLSQPRLNPPTGVVMHWSRLPDLPLAAVIWLSEPLLGAEHAALLAAWLVPPLLGVAFFAAFVWAAVPLTGRAGRPYAGLMVLALSIPSAAFAAGRIDHHGWQLLLATLGAGALLRLQVNSLRMSGSTRTLLAGGVGLAGALGLWIGAEAIPPVAFAAAVLALGWLRHGHRGALAMFWYGLALSLASLLILPLALPLQSLWSLAPAASACDAFSWVSLGLAATVLLFALGALLAERRLPAANPLSRATAVILIALPLLGLLYTLFPHCAGGPYSGLTPTVEQLITRISEAQSLSILLQTRPATAAQYAVLPLFGWLLCATWLMRAAVGRPLNLRSARRLRLDPGPDLLQEPILALMLLITGGLLLQFWQLRGSALAHLYAGLACAAWAAAVGARIRPSQPLSLRLLRRAGPVVLVGLLPILSGLAVSQTVEMAQTAIKNQAKGLESGDQADCDLLAVAERLNQPDLIANGPLLIAAPINLGAPLLWLTPHDVLSAPYHRNAQGIEDAQQSFFADAAKARALVEQRGIDLMLICPHDPVATHERRDAVTLFYDQLRAGDTPDWLTALPFAGEARLLVPQADVTTQR